MQCEGFSLQHLLLPRSTGSRHSGFRSGSRMLAQSSWSTRLVAPWHVGSCRTRDRTGVPCFARQILNHWTTREALCVFCVCLPPCPFPYPSFSNTAVSLFPSVFRRLSFFFFRLFYNWRIIALLCGVGFCCTTTQISHNYIYIYIYLPSLLEKAMAPHSSTLAWKIPWTEEPCGLQSMGSRRVRHD